MEVVLRQPQLLDLSGVHRDTILRLSVRIGEQAGKFMHETMNGLQVKNLHVDEIWSYVGKHQKPVRPDEDGKYIGDQYCFVAMDSDTKLIRAFKLAKRDGRGHGFHVRTLNPDCKPLPAFL